MSLTQGLIDAIKSKMDINDRKNNEEIRAAFQAILDGGSGGGSTNKYTVVLEQSGTGVPTVKTEIENTSGVTFTLGRTGAGIYTITSSAPIFDHETLKYFFGRSAAGTTYVANGVTVDSSTQITFSSLVGFSTADFNTTLLVQLEFLS